MPKGFHIVCLEPGADNPKKHTPPPEPEPPEGFVDNTVYRYRIDEDGNKVLIGTMEAYPEGWDHPQQFREKGFQKKKEDEKIMARYHWKALWPQVQELQAAGNSIREIAEELDIELSVLRAKIYREKRIAAEKQTPEPEPAAAANQEPERESQEPATEIIPVIMPLENDLTADDEEPIPYILAPDHHDVAEEIACLLDRKGQDYGTENIKKFGSYGVLVRVSDKVERLINLSRKEGQVNFESVEDSWKDIAGYAILALIELREGR
jgi:pyruvate/2-oxoglutarate dehydrogenase complex dihydrolipoamide acyltransferase (E2) component